MVKRALGPGVVAILVAWIVGSLAGGAGVGSSAAVGVAVVVTNFVASALAMAWAGGVSVVAAQVVALAGFIVRLGLIVGLMFALRLTGWFSTVAFGLAVVPGTLLLLSYESVVILKGQRPTLVLPGDAERVAGRGGKGT